MSWRTTKSHCVPNNSAAMHWSKFSLLLGAFLGAASCASADDGGVAIVSLDIDQPAAITRRYTEVICDGTLRRTAVGRLPLGAISSDGNWLLMTPDMTPDHRAYVVNRENQSYFLIEFTHSDAEITWASFSSDSNRLAITLAATLTAGEFRTDHYILVLDLRLQTHEVIGGPGEWYGKATFSLDGRSLIYATDANSESPRSDQFRTRRRPLSFAIETLNLDTRQRQRLFRRPWFSELQTCAVEGAELFHAWGSVGRIIATENALVAQVGSPIAPACLDNDLIYAYREADGYADGWLRLPTLAEDDSSGAEFERIANERAIRDYTTQDWAVTLAPPWPEPEFSYSPVIERSIARTNVRGRSLFSSSPHRWALSANGAFAWAPLGELIDPVVIVEAPLSTGEEPWSSEEITISEFEPADAMCILIGGRE